VERDLPGVVRSGGDLVVEAEDRIRGNVTLELEERVKVGEKVVENNRCDRVVVRVIVYGAINVEIEIDLVVCVGRNDFIDTVVLFVAETLFIFQLNDLVGLDGR